MQKIKELYKNDKGITIVSLLITIVVIITISVVSIGAMNDGGMVEQAEKVENTTNIKLLKKQIKQDILTEQLNTGDVTKEEINTILSKYNAVLNESGKIIIENGKYELYLVDIYNGEIIK